MNPPTATTAQPASAGRCDTVRFRCVCGRSVATQAGTDAERTGRCSSCRATAARVPVAVLHRR